MRNSSTLDSVCNDATFLGNRPATTLDLVGPDKKTLREKFIIGEPHACAAGGAEEMKRRGFVGIYQKEPRVIYRIPGSNHLIIKTW
ncbi:MAG: hypothetical protein JWM04_142 [Verrucomicrobiales bacterium]|nr:hypothetical protein [Verrucomicrobiales bacterium]